MPITAAVVVTCIGTNAAAPLAMRSRPAGTVALGVRDGKVDLVHAIGNP